MPHNEWSEMLDVDTIEGHLETTITAGEEARAALARRLNVYSVDSLSADLVIEPEKAGTVWHVSGDFRADLTQQCVVTLDPVHSHIAESLEGWFADRDKAVSLARARQEKEARKVHAEVEIMEESDDPESMQNGRIDLGELVTQHLSLAMNPYPHKDGVQHDLGDEDTPPAPIRKNPFEALKHWKSGDQ